LHRGKMNDELKATMMIAAEVKEQVVALETDLKIKKARLKEVQGQILKVLEMTGIEKVSGHGYTFFPTTKASVKTPKMIEEKELLFAFLREKNIFMEFASVNSASLNSLYNTLSAEAEEAGMLEFDMPGVNPPTYYTQLTMRRS